MKKVLKVIIIVFVALFLMNFSMQISYAYKEQYKENVISLSGLQIFFKDPIYYEKEIEPVSIEERENNDLVIGVIGAGLVVYWIILLIIFEREEVYDYTHTSDGDIELLRKYNPIVAGCLVGNREVLCKDLIAIVLSLVQKGILNMEIIPAKEGKDDYRYMVSRNRKIRQSVDPVEGYILKWLFGFYEQDDVDLVKQLRSIAARKDFNKHMRELNEITQRELNKIGANVAKMPKVLRIFNNLLLIFSIGLAVIHILNNGIGIHIYQSTILILAVILSGVILILPLVAFIIHIILLLVLMVKKTIRNVIENTTGKEIVETSVMTILAMSILIAIVYFFLPAKYLCLDIFMIGMCLLIVKTDNLMTKHEKQVLNDYYALQEVKYRIEEYSLIKEKQINYIKLWDEYLIYAVAFGIPVPIVDKLKESHIEDEDIQYLLKCEILYAICKSYLEVMWEMEFKDKKRRFSLIGLFNHKYEEIEKENKEREEKRHKF